MPPTRSPFTALATFWPSAGWRTLCASACTATRLISTSTATSIPRMYAWRPAALRLWPQERYARRLHHGARRGLSRPRPRDTPKRSPSFTLSADCIPTCRFNISSISCSGLKQRFPQVHLKAFTMVEVAYLARRAKLSIRETLEQLKASGVDSLPGGGAEIFADRVRHIICDHKIDGDQWLETAKPAHQIGLKSNATMLYGHVENDEDRVDHLHETARPAGRDRRLPDLYPARLPSRQHAAAASAQDHGHARHQADRGQPPGARQLPAYQSRTGR